jgi:heavy metal sensor kinase
MHSLRVKLIGWFLVVLLIVIVGFSLLLYITKKRAEYTKLDTDLTAAATVLGNRLDIEQGKIYLKPIEPNISNPITPFFYQITTEPGEIISQTPVPAEFIWPKSMAADMQPRFITSSTQPISQFRIVRYKAMVKEETEPAESGSISTTNIQIAYITCAGSMHQINEELEDLSYRLVTLGLLTFIIAGFGGFLISNRALKPITQISRTLSEISDTHLSDRIDIAQFDIELHPLVSQLNAALDRLEIAFQRERQFTADASHELRTPLSVIVNNIEVLLKRPRTAAEHLEVHQSNLRMASQMQTIIEGLLTLSRIDAGQIRLQKNPVYLYPLISDLFAVLQTIAANKQIRLDNVVDKSVQVLADADKLKQAIVNLIENAIRFNRHQGTVTIKSRPIDNKIAIEIIDTGIGIPPEHLTRIFERFYRVDPSRSENTGGCGLGLAIAKSIIELHAGTITVSSSSAGSIFTIQLPVS